jgi:NAD(P)H-dependent flavin oxidoreductase YrpB (nitropropane dioxygenase family)
MGVDAFVTVGFEGGGHVGIDRTPAFMLFPQIADTINIPVIAGGGISDGRQLAAAMALGAEGIYMGTRFIASKECPAHPRVKQAICEADYNSTATCTGIIGVLRALKNPLMDSCIEMEARGATPVEVTEFYSGGFREGILDGDMTNGVISFGMGAGMIREEKEAGDIVQDIIKEAENVTAGFG